MADEINRSAAAAAAAAAAPNPAAPGAAVPGAASSPESGTAVDDDRSGATSSGGERAERPIADFVRRAVTAGVVAAARSKDDIVRVAATEMRGWLDHLNLDEEIAKALAKMVIEVKTEIRFRPSEDGKLVPEATNDYKVKGTR
jgi:hypothetical protein